MASPISIRALVCTLVYSVLQYDSPRPPKKAILRLGVTASRNPDLSGVCWLDPQRISLLSRPLHSAELGS